MHKKAEESSIQYSRRVSRLAAIDGVGGDTGVKPQHRYVTCPLRHRPTLSFRFFFYSNKNYFVQLEDTTVKTERSCSLQRTERTRVLHHSKTCNTVCITLDERRFAAPKHRIHREVVLLFIYRLYIFTLFKMRVIILLNILYLSFISLWLRTTALKRDLPASPLRSIYWVPLI